jgi:O-antigen ligase
MDWSASRLSAFAGLGARFSSISAIFQQYVGRDLINANTIGGALTFHPPLLLALLWDRGAYQRAFLRKNPHAQRRITLYKLLLIFTLLLVMLTILVSSSTGSILGAGVGLLFLLIWKDHRFLWLVPVLILLALGLLYSQINGSLSEFFTLLLKKQHDSIISRLDVWRDTVYIIRDFPLTGVGLGNFGSVLKDFYNSNLFPQTATYYFHPHNTLLSVAVDLGIPALVLYVALLSGTFAMVLKTMKRVRSLVKYLLMGLLSGLLAHQVFGLTDAYVLGKKLGLIMWIFIGLVAAIYVNKHPLAGFSTSSEDSPAHIKPKMGWQNLGLWAKQLLIGIGLWVVISLIAVTIVNFNTYLSLVLALVGGVFLGVYLVKNTSMKRFDR